ncbi:MAG TPA: 50S ribosomal protein L4 [Candidatus Pacebacteria bacterium]|nr:50S ribosomal protein L4 [Candidatus Paceibacterota bacterium]HIP33893.1 50S ribosomal protein L4 [Bacteroidia bacterium]
MGGGVTFGPRNERNFKKKINKKMRNTAFFQVIAQKMRDGEVLFVDSMNFDSPKTKLAKDFLENVSKVKGFEDIITKKKNSAIIANTELNQNNIKAFSNFSNIKTEEFRKLSILDLLNNKYLVIVNPAVAMGILEAKKK